MRPRGSVLYVLSVNLEILLMLANHVRRGSTLALRARQAAPAALMALLPSLKEVLKRAIRFVSLVPTER